MDKSPSTRDIAVVGAGALGRWIAARMASGGADVSLVTRPGTNTGTTSCSIIGDHTAGEDGSQPLLLQEITSGPATAFCNEKFRWLLLCTKARDLEAAVRETKDLIAVDGCIAVLSNGLGHTETLKTFGIERCVTASVTYGLFAAEDGSVHRCGDGGEVVIGPLDTGSGEPLATEQSEELARRFTECSIATRVVADGTEQVWRKVMLNAGINPVAALLGCKNGDLPAHSAFALCVEAAREVQGVAIAAGVDLTAIDAEQALRDLCRDTATNRCSTLQDLDAGRPTEMEWVCGSVVRIAESDGQEAPANRLLGALVRDMEMTQAAS